nr:hypothetical protein [Sporomusa acidovorans]
MVLGLYEYGAAGGGTGLSEERYWWSAQRSRPPSGSETGIQVSATGGLPGLLSARFGYRPAETFGIVAIQDSQTIRLMRTKAGLFVNLI